MENNINLYVSGTPGFRQISPYGDENNPRVIKVSLTEAEYEELKTKIGKLVDSQDVIEELVRTKGRVGKII